LHVGECDSGKKNILPIRASFKKETQKKINVKMHTNQPNNLVCMARLSVLFSLSIEKERMSKNRKNRTLKKIG
jgi:hypothetical protein